MRDASSWSLSLGRPAGVPVRLHASFLACAIGAMFVAYRPNSREEVIGWGLLAALIWFVSLIAHQIGHLVAAARLGGTIDRVVIGPLGDMSPISVPHEPRAEAMAALAGPATHLLILVTLSLALAVSVPWNDIKGLLFSPFSPDALVTGGIGRATLKMAFWCNWLLMWANLMPALPLDGGRAAAALLRPGLGERGGALAVARFGTLLCICGLVLLSMVATPPDARIPAWLPLSLVSLWLFFEARRERLQLDDEPRDTDLLGYDFSQGYTSLERHAEPSRPREPGPVQRWLRQRREQKQARLRQIEADEERRVDQVLARVKDLGLEGLTAEERALLDRVSARYRNRLSTTGGDAPTVGDR